MTPKEKAQELLNKFDPRGEWPHHAHTFSCICVDEIIKSNPTEMIDGALFTIHTVNGMVKVDNSPFWQQVKQELQKM